MLSNNKKYQDRHSYMFATDLNISSLQSGMDLEGFRSLWLTAVSSVASTEKWRASSTAIWVSECGPTWTSSITCVWWVLTMTWPCQPSLWSGTRAQGRAPCWRPCQEWPCPGEVVREYKLYLHGHNTKVSNIPIAFTCYNEIFSTATYWYWEFIN